MGRGAPMLERVKRLGRQLTTAKREAQPVAGHGIDEAGGVAGEQQPGRAGHSQSTASGPRQTGVANHARGSKPVAQLSIAEQRAIRRSSGDRPPGLRP